MREQGTCTPDGRRAGGFGSWSCGDCFAGWVGVDCLWVSELVAGGERVYMGAVCVCARVHHGGRYECRLASHVGTGTASGHDDQETAVKEWLG